MDLPQDTLDTLGTLGTLDSVSSNTVVMAELVFATGHEIQHSFNGTVTTDATRTFAQEVEKWLKS